jgi:RNase H-fold protein (predicted Holliday junction resolvase)
VRTIGILTQDFELFYDLLRLLKRRGLAFKVLDFREPVPGDVGVVITGPGEAGSIDHPRVVVADADRDEAVAEAIRLLSGMDNVRTLVVGIDPGEKRIGFALVADGTVLEARQLHTLGEVEEALDGMAERYSAKSLIVRVGHGAPTVRNRIVNAALGMNLRVEISDETSTTRRVDLPDVEAAITIAGVPGVLVGEALRVSPSKGELRHIKKQSRDLSGGDLTISSALARRVALGELSLDEAVAIMKGER